jgi:carboxyl-terminal processing protease
MKKNLTDILKYTSFIILGILLSEWLTNNQKNSKIESILKIIEKNYVDSIDINSLYDNSINDIMLNLDPHSSYINSEKFNTVKEDMQGSFSGIGVQFSLINDTIVVVAPIAGGPSEKLGILSGDRIVYVEKELVANIKIKNEDVIKKLRGVKGSTVNIDIYRKGNNKLINYNIVRDDIPLKSVDASIMLDNNIGYIKLNRFAATSYEEFSFGVEKLLKNGMEKLILDLRNNPGGYLGVAINICDDFLKDNQLIVYTQGNKRTKDEIYSTKNGDLINTELVVLIDEGSASASEIVAGAIQDNDRGTVIGRRSFGKGLVQEQIKLNDNSVIRITTQRYYTPSGRCIQKPYKKNNFIEEVYDSTIYKTKFGRKVYASGGIYPDILVELDSSLNFSKLNELLSLGLINEFCLNESIKTREEGIKKTTFLNLDESTFFSNFISFLDEKYKSNYINNLGVKEKQYLNILLISKIAQNIWGDEIYYLIQSKNDEFIKEAIHNN